ncbi:hypothetical protein V8C43DRAFT_295132 [Trichoderma afarasin]
MSVCFWGWALIISVRRIWGAVRVSWYQSGYAGIRCSYDASTVLYITDMPCKRQCEHTRQCSCLFEREFVRVSQERHVERKNRTWLILVPRTRFIFFFFSCDGNGDAARDLHTNNVHHQVLRCSKTDATR